MQLVERQVIKPNHRFNPEADRLFLLSQNLDNCNHYLSRQKFSGRQPTNALAVHRALKKSVNNHKALSVKVTENTLSLLLTAWTSDRSVRKMAIAQLNFKQHRKILNKKIQKTREQGRYIIALNCQTVSKNTCPKRSASLSETNILRSLKVS